MFGKTEELVDGSSVIVDEAYITKSILNPSIQLADGFADSMPKDFMERIEAREEEILQRQGIELDMIADFIAYIESLAE